MHMINLLNVESKHLIWLGNEIMKNYKYAIKLDVGYASKITNKNHMTKLKELYADGSYWINDGWLICKI